MPDHYTDDYRKDNENIKPSAVIPVNGLRIATAGDPETFRERTGEVLPGVGYSKDWLMIEIDLPQLNYSSPKSQTLIFKQPAMIGEILADYKANSPDDLEGIAVTGLRQYGRIVGLRTDRVLERPKEIANK